MTFPLPLRASLAAATAAALLLIGATGTAEARNTFLMQPLSEVFNMPDARQRLDPSIRLYFADQQHPQIQTRRGGYYSSNKVRAAFRSDAESCRAAALESLLALQERARQVGANAVVDIVSYYEQRANPNNDRYECHAGNVVTEVAFRGDMVTLDQ
ncbi:hypothetical protein [Kushneria aurantia]|uniref:Excinuclease ATPase subunit n=1 Tax=Kushneria aurantia TaxID=504092 RepID=A0ABV6G112_9GAMM|nr:hypothetical protein [Kushneria aurantia]